MTYRTYPVLTAMASWEANKTSSSNKKKQSINIDKNIAATNLP
ncbi:hypothetical protein GbCGDNIH6_7077 [Granulibacter bethesdensis]|nr:hypothetical protein GbCGDNIH6_7077 [Granulibacter bethesdensis]